MTRLSTRDFQIGDRVRFTLGQKGDPHHHNEGTVKAIRAHLLYVTWDHGNWMEKGGYNELPFNAMHHEVIQYYSDIIEPSEDIYNDLI